LPSFSKSRRSCQICNKKHPTSLHDYNWKPEEAKTEGKKSQQKESETNERKREDQVNVCTAICNVTEAGDAPITMGIVPVWLYHKDNPNNKICVYVFLDNASGGTFIKEHSLRKLGIGGNGNQTSAHHYAWHPRKRYKGYRWINSFPLSRE